MPITFACPGCQRIYSVSDRLATSRVKCKACLTWMQVPDTVDGASASTTAPPEPTAPPPAAASPSARAAETPPLPRAIPFRPAPAHAEPAPAREPAAGPAEPAPVQAASPELPAPAPAPAPQAAEPRANRQFLVLAVGAGTVLLLAALGGFALVLLGPVRQASDPGRGEAAPPGRTAAAPGGARAGQAASALPPADLAPWTPDLTAQTLPPLPARCEGVLFPNSPASPYILLLRAGAGRPAPGMAPRLERVVFDLRSRRDLCVTPLDSPRTPGGALSPCGRYVADVVPGGPLRLSVQACADNAETAFLPVQRPVWFEFASSQRLAVLDAARGGPCVWNHFTGQIEREVPLGKPLYALARAALSPDGRRMAISDRPYRASDGRSTVVIHQFDLQAGTALNDLWLTGGEGVHTVEGMAFSGEGQRLAVLFRLTLPTGPALYRVVAWELGGNGVLHNHAVQPALLSPHLACRWPIQWMGDGRSWLLDGRVVVDAATGNATAAQAPHPVTGSRAVGPGLALSAVQVGLPARYELRLVAAAGR